MSEPPVKHVVKLQTGRDDMFNCFATGPGANGPCSYILLQKDLFTETVTYKLVLLNM